MIITWDNILSGYNVYDQIFLTDDSLVSSLFDTDLMQVSFISFFETLPLLSEMIIIIVLVTLPLFITFLFFYLMFKYLLRALISY